MLEIGQKYGMQTMNSDLVRLVNKGLISKKDAMGRSPEPEAFLKLLGE
jgi:Tfp pilus assembly pilus retraction ATPase PilT